MLLTASFMVEGTDGSFKPISPFPSSGHEPLSHMLRSNSETLRRVLKADLNIHSREPAQVLDAFQGLRRCDSFVQALRQGTPIPIQEFTDDLRHRLRAVWRDVEG
eukprot:1161961-Pelagomonas_calceolata.AAC.1